MKTMFTVLALFIFINISFSQNENWNLPEAEQDTAITFIKQVKATRTAPLIMDGDTVAILNAKQIAARWRIKNDDKKWYLTVTEINHEVANAELTAKNELFVLAEKRINNELDNVAFVQACRDAMAKVRQYTRIRTMKKGNIVDPGDL